MPRDKVAAYIYEIGAEHPAMANMTKSVLRKLLAHAVRHGWRADNPVTEVDNYKLGITHGQKASLQPSRRDGRLERGSD